MPSRKSVRGGLATVLASAVVAAGLAVVAQVTAGPSALAAASEAYNWRNVEIQGGGFVPSIIFNQTERNLVYARTDIGGAYRLDPATNRWIPLLDWVGQSNWGYNGVHSLATDPIDPNNVYVAAGMYTNGWDPNNGAILRSRDRGRTWAETKLPFPLGGNMPGRGMGERLAIDPNDNRILYFGAPSGKGLWKSTDSGVTWAQVANFPNLGMYVDDPAVAYLNDPQGIPWVTFDPSSSTRGTATRDIYVGVADKANMLYRSTDAGATWTAVPGTPTGYLPHKGVLDHVNHILYLATSDTAGPYNGGDGQVLKFHTRTGVWTDITPEPAGAFGYTGLTIDRQNPGTIMVGSQIQWWPDTQFYRSTDGGTTWTRAWDWAGYPTRSFRYRFDVTNSPWVELNPNQAPPESPTKLGWMNEGIEIDPFNSDRLFYGTGLTLYGTTNLTDWDTPGGQAVIRPMAAGLEETAVLDLASLPSGPPLISALGDIGGFAHTDLTRAPVRTFQTPAFTTTHSVDFAERSPGTVVRAGTFDRSGTRANDKFVAFSTDGGLNWFQAQEPAGSTGGGTVAAAADASRFVLSPTGTGVHYSVGYGNTWTASTGIPAGAVVESDRVNPMKFYGVANGTFYTSVNGGATFTAGATGLPERVKFHAVPGVEGDIWLAGFTGGLFHSTDSGATFTRVSSVTEAANVALGRAAPGRSYQSLYIIGTVDGVHGVYRSDDTGATWVRINDDQHQYGNAGEALSGDPRVYGRVYLGTNGRGVLVADRLGGSPTTPPVTSAAATSPPVTSPPVTSPPVTSPPVTSPPVTSPPVTTPPVTGQPVSSAPGAGGCTATYQVTNSWPGGFQGVVLVTNTGPAALTGWTVNWTFPNGQTVASLWGGVRTVSGAAVSVRNENWNGNLGPGATNSIGFIGTWQGTNAVPASVTCTSG